MKERILNSMGFIELLLLIMTINSCSSKVEYQLEQVNTNLITLTETIQSVKGARNEQSIY